MSDWYVLMVDWNNDDNLVPYLERRGSDDVPVTFTNLNDANRKLVELEANGVESIVKKLGFISVEKRKS